MRLRARSPRLLCARVRRALSPCAACPAQFDTSVIPWWAWVRRFHLPEAEQINGRAAVRAPARAARVTHRRQLTRVLRADDWLCHRLLCRCADGRGAGGPGALKAAPFAPPIWCIGAEPCNPAPQTNNFFGKLLMWTTFAGVAFIRSTKDLDQYKLLLKEVRRGCCVLRGAPAHVRPHCRRPPSTTSSGPPPGRASTARRRTRSRPVVVPPFLSYSRLRPLPSARRGAGCEAGTLAAMRPLPRAPISFPAAHTPRVAATAAASSHRRCGPPPRPSPCMAHQCSPRARFLCTGGRRTCCRLGCRWTRALACPARPTRPRCSS